MPISVASAVVKPSKDRFYEVDHEVTGLAFQIHNEFGRLLTEFSYQRELASRIADAGLSVVRELRIVVSFRSFTKKYFVDHFIETGVPIEAKAVAGITGEHRSQLLNYLFLCDLNHGTILNFRPSKVEHEFVSTHLTLAKRREYKLHHDGQQSKEIRLIEGFLTSLLDDWGTHLSLSLYRDALAHLLADDRGGYRDLEIYSRGETIGTQRIAMVTEDVAISVTSGDKSESDLRVHLRRLLNHTRLRSMVWIHMVQSDVTLTLLHPTQSCLQF